MSEPKRYVRFVHPRSTRSTWGERVADRVHVLTDAPWIDPTPTDETLTPAEAAELRFLAPAQPSTILALGYNYKDLVADPKAISNAGLPDIHDPAFEPVVFLKGRNCVSDPGAEVEIPAIAPAPAKAGAAAMETWVENELAIVLGRRVARGAVTTREAALACVAGVTIGNDISCLNILNRDWHLARSKSLDGFCPLGPELVAGLDDSALRIRTWVNERLTQDSTTANRILDTAACVMLASKLMTLEAGDVILTGSPRGARQSVVQAGDRVELEIEGIGRLQTAFRR